jgi:hypothetical protein
MMDWCWLKSFLRIVHTEASIQSTLRLHPKKPMASSDAPDNHKLTSLNMLLRASM